MKEERRKLVEAVEEAVRGPIGIGGAFTSGWEDYQIKIQNANDALRAYDAENPEEVE